MYVQQRQTFKERNRKKRKRNNLSNAMTLTKIACSFHFQPANGFDNIAGIWQNFKMYTPQN